MAVAILKVTKEYTLTLSQEEVLYLKALLQNPYMYPNAPEEEPQQEYDIRQNIFETLYGVI